MIDCQLSMIDHKLQEKNHNLPLKLFLMKVRQSHQEELTPLSASNKKEVQKIWKVKNSKKKMYKIWSQIALKTATKQFQAKELCSPNLC